MARNSFNSIGHAVAAKPFRYAGVEYDKGEEFPHRDLGIIEHELRGLWLADLIDFVDEQQIRAGNPVKVNGKRSKSAKPNVAPRAAVKGPSIDDEDDDEPPVVTLQAPVQPPVEVAPAE